MSLLDRIQKDMVGAMKSKDEARLKEAIDHYRQAVRLDPEFDLPHGALGQALLARHEFTEAEAETRRCLDLLPEGAKNFRANLEGQLQRCQDRKSTRLNSSHRSLSRMPSSA